MYTGLEPGGQLTTTTEVDNFLGIQPGITGPEMMMDLQNRQKRFDTKVHYEMITKAEFSKEAGGVHKLYAGNKEILTEQLLSLGATAKYLGLEDEKKICRRRFLLISLRVMVFLQRKKDVVVVGAGDTAAEEATFNLAKLCKKVTLLVRKDVFRASKAMVPQRENTPNIEVKFHHELIGIEGENSLVERAVIINNQTQEKSTVDVEGILFAIGHKPNTDIFIGSG